MKFYLRMEGVNLANFVYDTKDLSTIRGGSLLLLDAVERQVRTKQFSVDFERISTGASSGLFQFDAVDDTAAEQVRKEIETFLKTHTKLKHATFAVDVQRDTGDFVSDKEMALARNRWRQMQQPTVAIPQPNTNLNVGPCDEDLTRPATALRKTTEDRYVSTSVQTRWEYGRAQKHNFYPEQTGEAQGWEFAYDFNELTYEPSRGNLHHKMAVIYVDGNKFTDLRDTYCKDTTSLSDFDERVKTYRRKVLKSLLQLIYQERDSWISFDGHYRLETLLWGGDEFIWVLPAWQGWRILTFFYQQSQDWEFASQPLTHAAGIVFCHHTAPIQRIRALAEGLAELAKQKNRKEQRQENRFSYLVLESFDHIGRDLPQFLSDRYGDSDSAIFSATGMDQVEAALTKLKRDELLPRSKLHSIVQSLQKEPAKAEELSEKVMANASPELKILREYFDSRMSGWLHIAELWDYIGS